VSAMTWADILGCLRAVAMFAFLLEAPGHCAGWALNLLGFRQRGVMQQIAWSVALSFAIMPIVAVMVAKYGSLGAVVWVAIGCGLITIGLNQWAIWHDRDRRLRPSRLVGIALGLAWMLFVIAELVDVGMGNHLYMSVTIFDHTLRTAFVDSVMRTGVPPLNPLYWPGHGAPMRYYYFWYVLTAVAARLSLATARQAMIASVVWAGFGLAAAVGLYCRHFLGERSVEWRWSRGWIALGLLAVTGLDVLPAIAKAVARMPTDADMEWWSPDQVTSWLGSVLWVPHHVAGLVCCLLGFLLAWMAKAQSGRQRTLCGVVAGLAFASAFGLSTWVAVAFAMVMAGWAAWVMGFARNSRGRVMVLLLAAVVAMIALLPYLAELHGETSGVVVVAGGADAASTGANTAASAAHLLRFGVRHMIDPDALLGVPGFARLAQVHPQVEDALAGLVLLLPGYFVELGFYGLVLVAAVRGRARLDEAERTALVLAGAGLVVATFLRSTVVVNNDFGIRSILIAQFFLLMLGVSWFEGGLGAKTTATVGRAMDARRWGRRGMMAMVWIGIAGTVYQAGLLRVYLPVEDRLGRAQVSGLAERAMALRRGFDAMDGRVSKDAVVQFDPAQPGDYFRYAQILEARRQIVSALPVCPAAFGGDPAACAGVEDGVARLFPPRGGSSAEAAREECGRLRANDLAATRWDGVWADRAGWVWTLPAVVDTGEMRVVDCGM
jgi:hypothetical protein